MKILSGINRTLSQTGIRSGRGVHIALLLLTGIVIYANSFGVPFILDDHYTIEFLGKQGLIEQLLHGSIRRVADITFILNYRIHGLEVAGYHITNLAIHLGAAVLLYFLAVSCITALRVSYAADQADAEDSAPAYRYLPFAAALLFVSHPVQTQAVTYIIQRYTTLATFFYFLSALCFVRARLALEGKDQGLRAWLMGGCTLAAALLAFGSKQIAVTLPLMLVVLELFLFRGRLINRRFFAVCGVIMLLVLGAVFVRWHGSSLDDFLFDLRHATSEDQYISRSTYFFTQTRVVATYLRLLCLPYGQNLVHDSPMYPSLFALPVAASLVLHGLLMACAVVLFRKSGANLQSREWLRGVFQRLAAAGIVWFYLAMTVESSIIPIRDIIFEHRIYLPSAGFFLTVTALGLLAVQGTRSAMKFAGVVLAAVCLTLGGMTVARNHVWNDALTLWEDAAGKSPGKWLALANLAGEYLYRNMPEKAIPLYVRAIELNPNLFIISKVCLGDALKALNLYGSRFTTGQEYIQSGGLFGSGVLDYRNLSKWEGVVHNNMGLACEYMKQPEKALAYYKVAVSMNPAYDLAWFNMALVASRLGYRDIAYKALGELQTLNPQMARALATAVVR